jgi:hypothetical protein
MRLAWGSLSKWIEWTTPTSTPARRTAAPEMSPLVFWKEVWSVALRANMLCELPRKKMTVTRTLMVTKKKIATLIRWDLCSPVMSAAPGLGQAWPR